MRLTHTEELPEEELRRACDFLRSAMSFLCDHQSYPPRGDSRAERMVAITRQSERTYDSVAGEVDGPYQVYHFPEAPVEAMPMRMDQGSWKVLQFLSGREGGERWAGLLAAMTGLFAEHGFESRTGLAWTGWEADFHLLMLTGVPSGSLGKDTVSFKPRSPLAGLPLWEICPEKLVRMVDSAWLGLVTDEDAVSFNRYCYYNFDAACGQRGLEFSAHHCAFQSTAALLAEWNLQAARRVPAHPERFLKRAFLLTEKFFQARHPESGLLPHMFHGDGAGTVVQSPYPMVHAHDLAAAAQWVRNLELWEGHASQAWIDGQREIHRRNAGTILDACLEGGQFHEWLSWDGTRDISRVRYTFPDEESKARAAARDPRVANVAVFSGPSLYEDGPWAYGVHGFGLCLPKDFAVLAAALGDPGLAVRLDAFWSVLDAAPPPEKLNAAGQYTASADIAYAVACAAVYQVTGRDEHRRRALLLLDRVVRTLIPDLANPAFDPAQSPPAWFRLPIRNVIFHSIIDIIHYLT